VRRRQQRAKTMMCADGWWWWRMYREICHHRTETISFKHSKRSYRGREQNKCCIVRQTEREPRAAAACLRAPLEHFVICKRHACALALAARDHAMIWCYVMRRIEAQFPLTRFRKPFNFPPPLPPPPPSPRPFLPGISMHQIGVCCTRHTQHFALLPRVGEERGAALLVSQNSSQVRCMIFI
jgi:hypothetical protein